MKTHMHAPPEQVKLIKDFLKHTKKHTISIFSEDWCRYWTKHSKSNYLRLITLLRKVYSPVDLYDHNDEFKAVLIIMGVRLVWGIHASRAYRYAYVQRYALDAGCEYTILSNHDFSKIDPNYPWENWDIFLKE